MASAMRMSDLFVILLFTLSFSGRIIRFIRRGWKSDGHNRRLDRLERSNLGQLVPGKASTPARSAGNQTLPWRGAAACSSVRGEASQGLGGKRCVLLPRFL